jgi:hypothetical protein
MGCGPGFVMNTPAGFAELDDNDAYAFRATSAEGVVVAVRREANDPKGNLDFWASAIGYELERKGYARLSEENVQAPGGVSGKQLRYHVTQNGRPHVFWATVFVTDRSVVVVEAGGDEAHFDRVKASVDLAIRRIELG